MGVEEEQLPISNAPFHKLLCTHSLFRLALLTPNTLAVRIALSFSPIDWLRFDWRTPDAAFVTGLSLIKQHSAIAVIVF